MVTFQRVVLPPLHLQGRDLTQAEVGIFANNAPSVRPWKLALAGGRDAQKRWPLVSLALVAP
jgi:hypothetical protein